MATPKTGLTVAIKFTPQAQSDSLTLHEDQLNDGSQSLTNAADATQNVLANDGGGAGTQIMGIVAGNAVDLVKQSLATYVDINNFSSPKAAYSDALIGSGDLAGHVVLANNGLVYKPAHDISFLSAGETVTVGTFTYIIRMGNGAFSVTTATITLVGDNDGPVAQADVGSTHEDQPLIGTVAANDHDVDHLDTLTYTLDNPVDGLVLHADGTYNFDAGNGAYQHLAEGATINVVVSYTVTDNHGASASSTLTITVTGTNDVPVAAPATNAGNEDTVVSGAVHATDVDDGAILSYAAQDAPAGFAMATDGSYTLDAGDQAYQSLAEGETADVVVDYTVTDEHGASSASTVTITLTGVNDGPVAQADVAAATEDTVITGSVAGNDSDVDHGAVLTWSLDESVAGLVLNEDGSFTFDAGDAAYQGLNAGDVLPVVAHYTVTDEHGATAQSTLTISVAGANEAPPPPPEPTQHQGAFAWTVTGNSDPYAGSYALEGSNWSNFHISVNGTGDFDWKKEGFDITGDVTGGYRGPNEKNAMVNSGAESNTTYSAGNVSVTLNTAGLADGHLDYDVALTNQTNNNSQVNFTFTYDYWA